MKEGGREGPADATHLTRIHADGQRSNASGGGGRGGAHKTDKPREGLGARAPAHRRPIAATTRVRETDGIQTTYSSCIIPLVHMAVFTVTVHMSCT